MRQGNRNQAPIIALYAVLIPALLTLSCATSSGRAYETSATGDMSAAQRAAAAKQDTDEGDGSPIPPWTQSGDPEATAGGSFSLGQTTFSFAISVPAYTGTLALTDAPPHAQLYVDGSYSGDIGPEGQLSVVVEAGWRELRVAAFGYADWAASVLVPVNGLADIRVSMDGVPFSLKPLRSGPVRFDPDLPGRLGTARADFRAAAPGSARASVLDGQGRLVRDLGAVIADGPTVSVRWDGSTAAGTTAPLGGYTVVLETAGGQRAELPVDLVDLPELRPSSLHGGFSGALLAPDARFMPEGAYFQMAAGMYAFVDPKDGAMRARAPVWLGQRIGLGPALELALSYMYVPYIGYDESPSASSASLSASLKAGLADGAHFAAALSFRGAMAAFTDEDIADWPPSWDGTGRFRGAGMGVILEGEYGRARIFASAEAAVSDFYPGWDDGRWAVPGFFAWLYMRAGLDYLLDLGAAGSLGLTASAAARSEPAGAEPGFRPPFSVAGELSWSPRNAPVSIQFFAVGEWANFSSWYFAGGLGFGAFF